MRKNTVEDIKQKFFFDMNIFDEDGNIESDLIEDEEPPLPVFSEAELEAAKKSAFQKGYDQAMHEAKNSRAQHLTGVLDVLSRNMDSLIHQDNEREELYERETVNLTLRIFETLFPYYTAQHGFGELTGALTRVLENHAQQTLILVKVAPDMVEGVEKIFNRLRAQNPELRYRVQGDDMLSAQACAVSWDNGGALHNNQAMADEILGILQEQLQDGLAGDRSNRHDDGQEISDEDAREVSLLISSFDNEDSDPPELEEKPDE